MKILIAGDFCPQSRVAKLFDQGRFETVLCEVRPFVEQADYSIVNFECPITKGGEKPISKCGPNLKCSEKGLEAVKWAGFECVTLANNHFLDYGREGVENTIATCTRYNIDTVGGGDTLQNAEKILYKEIKGKRLAIINCCEHEFSIATDVTAGSNPLNPIKQYYAIKEAKENADYILLIVHGGHEHYQLPSPRMQETYRFFIDAGADIVVNHHQHCYSGYETYKGRPIYYGLGNFCFDKIESRPNGWTEGYMVEITITHSGIESKAIPYIQCAEKGYIKMLPKDAFDMKLQELNQIIMSPHKLLELTEKYYSESTGTLGLSIEPSKYRLFSFLKKHSLWPSSWTKKSILKLRNYMLCESHRDKMEYYLNHYNN